jgi:hypothetical protein
MSRQVIVDMDATLKQFAKMRPLRIQLYGRLGNNILQIINAISLSHLVGNVHVYYDYGSFSDTMDNISCILGSQSLLLPDGITIHTGSFCFSAAGLGVHTLMDSTHVDSLVEHSIEASAPCRNGILSFLAAVRNEIADFSSGSQLVLAHIRGGDVFANESKATNAVVPRAYTQPPLSYYRVAIREIQGLYPEAGLFIQAQDSCNPVLEPLRRCLAHNKSISSASHSSALGNALCNVLSANHLISSRGTFIPSLALLSANCKTITFFRRPELPYLASLFALLGISVYVIADMAGMYTPEQEWFNLACQRKIMTKYPASFLSSLRGLTPALHRSLGSYVYL